jgi:hypothetical protein
MWLNKMGAGKAPARFLTRLDDPSTVTSNLRGRR